MKTSRQVRIAWSLAHVLVTAVVVLAAVAAPLRAQDIDGDVTFVQLSDIHADERHLDILDRFVERINALPMTIDFVVVTGDIFKDNILDESIVTRTCESLGRLVAPVHLVPGNHDILRDRLEETRAVYTNRLGGLISTAVYHNVGCVFAYTEPLAQRFSCPGYDPLTAVGDALQSLAPRPTLVFHHTPSTEDFYRDSMHPGWPEASRAPWTDLLNRYSVKGIIAGHYHRGELHWVGDVPLFVGPAIAQFWGRQPTFRIYRYRDGRLSYYTVHER